MKGSCTEGKEDGPFESFFKNGQPEWVCSFAKGQLHGPFESYHEDGQLESKGSYSDGKKCGEWTEGTETVRYSSCPPGRD
jgi:antitoxin component YwqK of YwqJK toxin-antitoxin module